MVAELALEDPRRAHHERDGLGVLTGVGEGVVTGDVEPRELLPAGGLAVQRLERGERAAMQRLGLEHRLVGAPRAVGLADALLPGVRGLEVQRHLVRRVLGERGLASEDVDHLVPLLTGGVDREQRRERRAVRGVELERVAPRVDGVVTLLEHRPEDGAELGPDGPQLVVVQHRGAEGDQRLLRRDELVPALARAVDRGEGAQRVEGRRLDVEHAAVALDGALDVVQALEVHRGDLQRDGHAAVGVELAPELALEHVDELRPAAGGLVQRRDGAQRLALLAADHEHLLVELHGVVGTTQVALGHARHAGVRLGALLVGVDGVELALLHREELGPLLLRGVDRVEGVEARAVAGVDALDDGAVLHHRGVGATEVVLQQPREAQRVLDLVLGVLRDARAALEDRHELLGLAGRGEEPVEGLEGVGVERRHVEHELVRALRRREVAALLLVYARQALADGDAHVVRRRLGLDDVGVDVGQLVPRRQRRREALHLDERAVVEGKVLDGLAEPPEGPGEVAALLLEDLRDAAHRHDALAHVGDEVQRAGLQVRELLPVLVHAVQRVEHRRDLAAQHAAREHRLERRHGLAVVGLHVDDLLVGRERSRRVVQTPVENLREAVAQKHHVVGREVRELELHAKHGGELGPALERVEEAVQSAKRRAVGAVDLEHPAVPRDGRLGVGALHLVDLPDAQQQLDIPVRIVGEAADGTVVHRDDIVPATEPLGEPLEVAEVVLDAGIERDGPRERTERRLGLVERRLLHLGHALQQLQAPRKVLGVPRLDLEHLDEALEGSRRREQRLEHRRRRQRGLVAAQDRRQRLVRRTVVRQRLDDLAVDLHRARHVGELPLVELRHAEAVRRHLVGIAREVGLALEHREQVEPPALRRVQRVELLDRDEVRRVELEHVVVRVDGAVVVAELGLLHRSHLEVDALLLVGVADERGLAVVHREQLGPAAAGDEDADERVERGHLAVVHGDDATVRAHRGLDVVEHRLLDLRGAPQELLLLVGVVADLGLAREHLGELPRLVRELVEALERAHRVEVRRLHRERGHLVTHGARKIPKALLAHRRRAAMQRDAHLAVGLGQRRDAGLEGLDEVLVGVQRARDAVEGVQRVFARRILGQRLAQRIEGPGAVVEGGLAKLRDAVQQVDAGAALGEAGLHLEGAHEAVPRPGGAVHGLQRLDHRRGEGRIAEHRLEGPHGSLLRSLVAHDLTQDVDGRGAVAEALVLDLGEAELQLLARAVVREGHLLREVLRERRPAAEARVRAIERGERHGVGGVAVEHRAVRADGGLGVAELLVLHDGDLRLHPVEFLRVRQHLEAPRQRGEHLGPASGGAPRALQRLEHRDVAGVRREHLLQRRHRVLHVAEEASLDLRHAHVEVAPEALVGVLRRRRADEHDDVAPALHRLGDPQQRLREVVVRRVLGERAAVGVEGPRRLPELGHGHVADAAQQRHAIRGVVAPCHEDLERAHEGLPVAAQLVDGLQHLGRRTLQRRVAEEPLEGLARAVVVRRHGEHLAVQRERRRGVAEPELRHRRELEPRLRRLGVVAGVHLELAAQHLGELVPLAALLVEPRERVEHRRLVAELRHERRRRRHRAVEALQLVLGDARDVEEQRAANVAVGGDLQPPLEHRQELRPLPARTKQRVEGRERVGVRHVDGQHRLVLRHGARDVVEVRGEHGARAEPQRHLRGVGERGVGERGLEGRLGLAPASRHTRGALEVQHRARRRRVLREGVEEPLEGLRPLAQRALVELAELAQSVDLLVAGRVALALHLERRREPPRVVRRAVHRDQTQRRVTVRRIDLEHLLEAAGGAVDLLAAHLPELRDLREERHLRRVRGLRVLGLALEQADELVPLAALLEEALELVPRVHREVALLQRLLRAAVVGVERKHAAPRLDGDGVVVETIAGDETELHEELHARRRVSGHRGLRAENLRELRVLLGLLVEPRELPERLDVARVSREHLLPQLRGDLRALHLLGDEARELGVAIELRRRRRRRHLATQDAQELVPVLALLVHPLEVFDGLRVLTVDLEDVLVGLDGLGLVREALEVDPRDALEQRHALVAVVEQLALRLQRLDEVLPALLAFELRSRLVELADPRRIRRRAQRRPLVLRAPCVGVLRVVGVAHLNPFEDLSGAPRRRRISIVVFRARRPRRAQCAPGVWSSARRFCAMSRYSRGALPPRASMKRCRYRIACCRRSGISDSV